MPSSPTHALTDEQPILLLQITDSHLFEQPDAVMHGINTDASLQAVLRQVRADGHRPDCFLATGDLSQDGSAAAYQRFRHQLSATGAPVRCLPGNHDLPATFSQVLGDWSQPIFDIGAWRVVLLDSTVDGSNAGHLAASQFDLLEQALNQAPQRHVLLALHHNPVQLEPQTPDPLMLDNAHDLFKRLAQWPQINVLLWGHVHRALDQRRHKLRMLATPSTCFQFIIRDGQHCIDDAAPGYRWLKLYNDGSLATGVRRISIQAWRDLRA